MKKRNPKLETLLGADLKNFWQHFVVDGVFLTRLVTESQISCLPEKLGPLLVFSIFERKEERATASTATTTTTTAAAAFPRETMTTTATTVTLSFTSLKSTRQQQRVIQQLQQRRQQQPLLLACFKSVFLNMVSSPFLLLLLRDERALIRFFLENWSNTFLSQTSIVLQVANWPRFFAKKSTHHFLQLLNWLLGHFFTVSLQI